MSCRLLFVSNHFGWVSVGVEYIWGQKVFIQGSGYIQNFTSLSKTYSEMERNFHSRIIVRTKLSALILHRQVRRMTLANCVIPQSLIDSRYQHCFRYQHNYIFYVYIKVTHKRDQDTLYIIKCFGLNLILLSIFLVLESDI